MVYLFDVDTGLPGSPVYLVKVMECLLKVDPGWSDLHVCLVMVYTSNVDTMFKLR